MAEAEAIVVTRWRCPHCHRSWSAKRRATEHAATCWMDPANRACKTCEHHHPAEHDGWEEPGHPEYCAVGIDMSDPDGVKPTVVQVGCPKWSIARWAAQPQEPT